MPADPQTTDLEAQVRHLRALRAEGRHDLALSQASDLLAAYPENRDLLLIAAGALRFLGRLPESVARLDRLLTLHPRYSLALQERGLCHVARKDAPAAIEDLLAAVNINPALPLAWKMLEGLYRLTGDQQNSAIAASHVATLAELPPAVVNATALFADGEIDLAEQRIRAFLLQTGDHPEAMRLLARIGMARNVLDDAELLLSAALRIAPEHQAARRDYVQVLLQRQKYREAREELAKLDDATGSDDPDIVSFAATIAVGLGEQEQAISLYERLAVLAPTAPDPRLWLGHALKTVGRTVQAVSAYREAAALRPDFGDAYWSLANLKTYRFDDSEIADMRRHAESEQVHVTDRIHLCFALGKAHEDAGAFAESWSWYARGNALHRSESRYAPELIEANTAAQIAVCTPDFFAQRQGWGDPAPDPIFIVGLPRSGSTLLEQILASHSQVEGTFELPDIQRIVQSLQGRELAGAPSAYPAVLPRLDRDTLAQMGAHFLRETQVHRSGRAFFIDKMPNNFRHIGLIHLILPNARIIDARREPMSCCFSNLKQLFAQGQEFTYGVEDIARYYRTYLDLMSHWDRVLPGRILRVQHEDVVEDLEGSVRRLLAFCGLEFEAACLSFHENRRSVRTPSAEQVRRPIFRDGLDAWKAYEPWLGDLKAALGDALTRYRD